VERCETISRRKPIDIMGPQAEDVVRWGSEGVAGRKIRNLKEGGEQSSVGRKRVGRSVIVGGVRRTSEGFTETILPLRT
jgi:hypothetical protein